MDFMRFMRLVRKYRDMGWSVQGQLDDVINGEPLEDMNPNALEMIREFVEAFEKVDGCADEDSFNVIHSIKEHLGDQ